METSLSNNYATNNSKETYQEGGKKTIQLWSCEIFVAIKHISLAKFSESTDLEVYFSTTYDHRNQIYITVDRPQ
jgi:hypothetical protein